MGELHLCDDLKWRIIELLESDDLAAALACRLICKEFKNIVDEKIIKINNSKF